MEQYHDAHATATTCPLQQLVPGDQIHWEDPDGGLCSKTVTIKNITILADDETPDDDDIQVIIVDTEDAVNHVFSNELTRV